MQENSFSEKSSKYGCRPVRYGCENPVLNINHVKTLTFNTRILRTMENVYIWLVPALTRVLIRKMFSFHFETCLTNFLYKICYNEHVS